MLGRIRKNNGKCNQSITKIWTILLLCGPKRPHNLLGRLRQLALYSMDDGSWQGPRNKKNQTIVWGLTKHWLDRGIGNSEWEIYYFTLSPQDLKSLSLYGVLKRLSNAVS